MQNSADPKRKPARARLSEAGLLMVAIGLGLILMVLGGTVKSPVFRKNAEGNRERVFVTNAQGEQELLLVEKNKFLNAQNLTQLAKDTSFIAIMAIGATMVIISGGIDLSVGAVYALASVLGALALQHFGPEGARANAPPAVGMAAGILVCLGVGAACGLLNGGMIVALKVHPFIITLGTMAIFRGVAFVITKGQSIGGFPDAFREAIRYEAFDGLTLVPLAVMAVVTVGGGVFLSRMASGRKIYAVGGNELASRFSGIRVGRVKMAVFFVSGSVAGLAALLNIGYYGGATSGDGAGYELNVIAAAVVGGASLSGGKGTALGAFLGALIIQIITSGIVILGIDQNYSQIIVGAVIILAVVFDQANTWLARRRLSAESARA